MNIRQKIKKGILSKSIRFKCIYCSDFTKSLRLKTSIKCLSCGKTTHLSYYDYDCPKCGAEIIEEDGICLMEEEGEKCNRGDGWGPEPCDTCEYYKKTQGTLVDITAETYNYAASMEYGSCYDWTETHKCWNCKKIYEYDNSNC